MLNIGLFLDSFARATAINLTGKHDRPSQAMKKVLPLILLATTCAADAANWTRPYVVHGDGQSCLFTFLDNTTYTTCDQSMTRIEDMRKKEDAWIDEQEAWEQRQLQETRDNHASVNRKHINERQESIAAMVAGSPKGWTCVIKRLPPGLDLLSMDYNSPLLDRCSNEFNADALKTKKMKK